MVDAAQGVEAQTVANAHLAIDNNLEIVPLLNKIDLPAADPDAVAAEVSDLLGDKPEHVRASRPSPGSVDARIGANLWLCPGG